jgi:hypothetical protein
MRKKPNIQWRITQAKGICALSKFSEQFELPENALHLLAKCDPLWKRSTTSFECDDVKQPAHE